jgi:L-lactate utilization protein LutB
MDEITNRCEKLHIERAMKNLKKNNIGSYFVESKEEVTPLIEKLINEGDVVGFGGSETLKQVGFFQFIKNGKYNILDRDKKGLTRDEIQDVNRHVFLSDVYFASANAVTEHGEIYEVDGNGNRVAAITYGPKSVILIVGKNKVVKNLRDAVERVKNVACPENTMRLKIGTVCNSTGYCVNGGKCDERHLMSAAPGSCPNSICSFSNVIASQTSSNHDRIKVIFVNENLGY